MTDLIERVDAAFSEAAGDAPVLAAPESQPPGRRRRHDAAAAHPVGRVVGGLGRPAVRHVLGAPPRGPGHGGHRGRPGAGGPGGGRADAAFTRALFGVAAAGNVAIAAFWLAVEGPQAVSAATAGIGVALSAVAVLVAVALALRPTLGSAWSSGSTVIASVIPAGVAALAIGGLFASTTEAVTASASRPAANPGGAARPRWPSRDVEVPGENSRQFQQILAGNTSEQSELKPYVPLDAADQAILNQQLTQALRPPRVPDGGLGQGRRHDPGRRHGARRRSPLPGDRRQRSDLNPDGSSTRWSRPRGSTPARPTTPRSSA